MWKLIKIKRIKGKRKWSEKNTFKVKLETKYPPHTQNTKFAPYGIIVSKLIITVAPHNLICPQGKTYPIKEIAISITNKIKPEFHTNLILENDLKIKPLIIWA